MQQKTPFRYDKLRSKISPITNWQTWEHTSLNELMETKGKRTFVITIYLGHCPMDSLTRSRRQGFLKSPQWEGST